MCGIAGILDPLGAEPLGEDIVRRMLAMMRHRGPDEFGVLVGTGLALGNARLSIIDLSGGQQPIGNEDGTLWIVYNGEVFNHLELRRELESRGHRFNTHTDTEVILHAYEDFGPDCLGRLNGQFAIAIWNERDRSLFLARDRVGVRPLFYTRQGGRLLFASEIKALLVGPGVPATPDPDALEQVFTFWSTLSPRTCFRGIVSLPPGHYLIAKAGQMQCRPYWNIRFPDWKAGRDGGVGVQESADQLRQLLVSATSLRLRADVPVGAYLSGGLDSSTIAAIIRCVGAGHLDTFSIAFDDPAFDESAFQRRMAQHLGTEHQVAVATHADIGRVFPEVIWHTETPIMRTAPAPMYLLSKLVRNRGYKVVLTGEGADEFLAGYDVFKEAMVRRFWARQPQSDRRAELLKRLYPDIGNLAATGGAYLRAFFGHRLADVNSPDYSHAVRWRNNRRTCRFLSAGFKSSLAGGTGDEDGTLDLPGDFHRWGPLQRAQYLEIDIFLSQYLLSSQGDRMGMAHSIEGRFPFLDHRVMEFCNQLPARFKLHGLTDKFLLRRVAREWLPEEIWSRPKRPYRAPIHRSFFNGAPPEYVAELLSEDGLRRAGIFEVPSVRQLVSKLEGGKPVGETDDMALVGIISTQLWHHQYIDHFAAAPPLSDADKVKVVRCASTTPEHP